MIVVDASVIVAVLMRTEGASTIEDRLRSAGASLHAPELIDLEVANTLRRTVAKSRSATRMGDAILAEYRRLPLRRYPHMRLLDRIWAVRHNITSYDAAYVALAEILDAPLLTRDARLANAGGHTARIELI